MPRLRLAPAPIPPRFAAAAASVVALAACAPAASAAPVPTTVTAGVPSASCPNPTFSTVQAALDAAKPLWTVLVCPGSYTGYLQIAQHDVTLSSVAGADATTLTGAGTDPDAQVPTLSVKTNRVTVQNLTINNDPASLDAIDITNSATVPTGGATVTANKIAGTVVVMSGAASIHGNRVVTGRGPSGIAVFDSIFDVSANKVAYAGDNTGIFLYDATGTASANSVSGAVATRGSGITAAYAPGATIAANRVSSGKYGIQVMQGATTVSANTVTGSGYGLFTSQGQNATFTGNTVSRSAMFDCYDTTMGWSNVGTANTWTANTGSTMTPARLCTAAGV